MELPSRTSAGGTMPAPHSNGECRCRPWTHAFPLNSPGVEFKQRHYSKASAQLRYALTITPDDPYANEFLGTVYFLQRNLEAALKYWNRVKKPEIANFIPEPPPKTDQALLDRAFIFSPASVMTLSELLEQPGANSKPGNVFQLRP